MYPYENVDGIPNGIMMCVISQKYRRVANDRDVSTEIIRKLRACSNLSYLVAFKRNYRRYFGLASTS